MRIKINRKDENNFIVGFVTIPDEVIREFPEENKTNGIDTFDVPDELQQLFMQQSYRFKIYRKNLRHYPEEINQGMSRTMIEDQLLKEIQKIESFQLLGLDTTTNEVKRDQLKKRLEELSETSSD